MEAQMRKTLLTLSFAAGLSLFAPIDAPAAPRLSTREYSLGSRSRAARNRPNLAAHLTPRPLALI